MNSQCRDRIDRLQLPMQRLPALLRRLPFDALAHRGSADGSGDNPSSNALKYNMVPPTSSGMRPAAVMSAISFSASARNSAAE